MTGRKGCREAVRRNEGWPGVGGKKNRVLSMVARALARNRKKRKR